MDLFLYELDEGAATAKVKQIYAAVKHANPQVPQNTLNESEYFFKPRNKSMCKSIWILTPHTRPPRLAPPFPPPICMEFPRVLYGEQPDLRGTLSEHSDVRVGVSVPEDSGRAEVVQESGRSAARLRCRRVQRRIRWPKGTCLSSGG